MVVLREIEWSDLFSYKNKSNSTYLTQCDKMKSYFILLTKTVNLPIAIWSQEAHKRQTVDDHKLKCHKGPRSYPLPCFNTKMMACNSYPTLTPKWQKVFSLHYFNPNTTEGNSQVDRDKKPTLFQMMQLPYSIPKSYSMRNNYPISLLKWNEIYKKKPNKFCIPRSLSIATLA